MTRRTLHATILGALAVSGARAQAPPAGDAAQPAPPVPTELAPDAAEASVAKQFAAELAALSPARVEGYLELAERVSDESLDRGHTALATRLCVIAYEVDRGRSARASIAASACLQIASLTGSTRDRQWLTSLARAIDPRQAPAGWVDQTEAATGDSASYRLAVLLGELRAGDGIPARRQLGDPEILGIVSQLEPAMRRTRVSSGLWEMQRQAERWPCRECGNQRFVKKMQSGVLEFRVCPVCRGRPGPDMTPDSFLTQLRFETWLLQGAQRSWAAQLGVDGGATLVDPDPGELSRVFGVDPFYCVWREASWHEDPAFPRPLPAPAAPPPDGAAPPPPSGS